MIHGSSGAWFKKAASSPLLVSVDLLFILVFNICSALESIRVNYVSCGTARKWVYILGPIPGPFMTFILSFLHLSSVRLNFFLPTCRQIQLSAIRKIFSVYRATQSSQLWKICYPLILGYRLKDSERFADHQYTPPWCSQIFYSIHHYSRPSVFIVRVLKKFWANMVGLRIVPDGVSSHFTTTVCNNTPKCRRITLATGRLYFRLRNRLDQLTKRLICQKLLAVHCTSFPVLWNILPTTRPGGMTSTTFWKCTDFIASLILASPALTGTRPMPENGSRCRSRSATG